MTRLLNGITAFLIDLSGTLHIGDTPTRDAVRSLERLQATGKPLRFLSNSSKESQRSLAERLRRMGFDIDGADIFTSLSAARQYVNSKGHKPMLLLSDSAKEDFRHLVPASESECDAVLLGLAPSELHYSRLDDAYRLLSRKGTTLIATHRAMFYAAADGLSLGPGGFISMLEEAAGIEAHVLGKPSKSFFELCLLSLPDSARKGVAMIGDDCKADFGQGCDELGMRKFMLRTGKYKAGDETKVEGRSPERIDDDFAALVDALLR
ncbi:uncharacterized protein L969DRAFT_19030 [Mixia osmundae IAM 14324]|uniref:Haloacid dehalogenase-like hydrolase domain-containing protein 2 n=1 Tax=Mixia osmundae (strain CBS 9802 / IAM 14324 / JCM 22182 / KY 12970) TaxID=764103 RepID=G7DS36_MIXOS|nr:uncharacterized protein L969DRAFT_19030 [Mixia osmundae IAM 14324]KEI37549.1 hypothetical protein L969DRAFT_19030 [Mixia osmundae IAM 14324]GAA93396.1 hypothetical protein E5Q_00037 [Mixia osmundae IAM 14324]